MEPLIIPIFPLPLLALEEEEIRLHIFEPRYKKLIHLCHTENSNFGIPTVFENAVIQGALVKVKEISKTYQNGDMDIVCLVNSRFEIRELYPAVNPLDYGHALVHLLDYYPDEDKELNLRIVDLLNEFYILSNLAEIPDFLKQFAFVHCIHKCGLGLEKEIELSTLTHTSERQLYVISHLKKAVMLLFEIQKMNTLIKLNGHYNKISSPF